MVITTPRVGQCQWGATLVAPRQGVLQSLVPYKSTIDTHQLSLCEGRQCGKQTLRIGHLGHWVHCWACSHCWAHMPKALAVWCHPLVVASWHSSLEHRWEGTWVLWSNGGELRVTRDRFTPTAGSPTLSIGGIIHVKILAMSWACRPALADLFVEFYLYPGITRIIYLIFTKV